VTVAFRGVIARAGFASGDRIVVQHWDDTPFGPTTVVLRTTPDGERVLLAPDDATADVFAALHSVDRVDIAPVRANASDRWIEVRAGDLEVQLKADRGWRNPAFGAPRWLPFVDALVGRAAGLADVDSADVPVRYRVEVYRSVVAGWAAIDGRDLGTRTPARSAIVAVRVTHEDPTGTFDALVRAAARAAVAPAAP
jgi:hypothetical protein